jgi:hypothetical protein
VGIPMPASGRELHKDLIVSASTEASLKPCAVNGRLSRPQGKTGQPLAA